MHACMHACMYTYINMRKCVWDLYVHIEMSTYVCRKCKYFHACIHTYQDVASQYTRGSEISSKSQSSKAMLARLSACSAAGSTALKEFDRFRWQGPLRGMYRGLGGWSLGCRARPGCLKLGVWVGGWRFRASGYRGFFGLESWFKDKGLGLEVRHC